MVGTLGRTQPARPRVHRPERGHRGRAEPLQDQRLRGARRRSRRAGGGERAAAGRRPDRLRALLPGAGRGDERADPRLEYAGGAFGAPLNRSTTPPWLAGNVLGTVTATARIGDVLLSAGPGEMYPQIALKVAELVGARGHMTAGLAGDQLGYLIAPFEAYPGADPALVLQPARRRGLADRQRQLLLQRVAHDGRPRDVLAAARRGRDGRRRARVPEPVPAVPAVRERPAARARGGRAGAERRLALEAARPARCGGWPLGARPRRTREAYRDGPVQADGRGDARSS